MKSVPRFFASSLLAAFLCFASTALGQASVNAQVDGSVFFSPAATPVFALAFGPGGVSADLDHRGGCSERDRRRGNCSQVPEGGTSFEYLALASLCGLAAVIFKFGRRASLQETN